MKRNQIILIGIFVVISGLMYFTLVSNKKESQVEKKEIQHTLYVPTSVVQNATRKLQLVSYGQVAANTELVISFEVQGKLEKGDVLIKPGVQFKQGQKLYKINNLEAFYALNSRKSQLANILINALPDIELDYPTEKNKWMSFLDQLKPENKLPELPLIPENKERMFLTSRSILSEYYNLKSQESRLEKYHYTAPFNGTVLEVFAEPGAIVNPGTQISKIAKTGDFEVKIPISIANINSFKKQANATFKDAHGETVGKGKMIRSSNVVNQRTQSIDVYYSINPAAGKIIYNGMFLTIAIKQSAAQLSAAIPRAAVKDGKVHVLKNNQMTWREVLVVGSKPDTLFVSGLKDNEQVVLELVEKSKEITTIKGVQR
jgi:membrane fusion protein (multidrug efflux system)